MTSTRRRACGERLAKGNQDGRSNVAAHVACVRARFSAYDAIEVVFLDGVALPRESLRPVN
ncbi:MAG: hypothetical protein ABR499_05530 [Gemmatimonadaceae bacterium]